MVLRNVLTIFISLAMMINVTDRLFILFNFYFILLWTHITSIGVDYL